MPPRLADFWRNGEAVELQRCFDAVGLGYEESLPGVCRRLRTRATRAIMDMIRRYGDDGMGDKPPEMSRVAYWFQHIDMDDIQGQLRTEQRRADKRAEKRQRRE